MLHGQPAGLVFCRVWGSVPQFIFSLRAGAGGAAELSQADTGWIQPTTFWGVLGRLEQASFPGQDGKDKHLCPEAHRSGVLRIIAR